MMGIKRFDHETKVKARSERQNLQAASQLCTKQVGTGEINQIIESLLKMNVRATGAQDSRRILSYITVCGYDTTHLQENPQRLG